MQQNNPLQAALNYEQRGFSVIPVNPENKKPFIKWAEYQNRKATPAEVQTWWTKWPGAMIGIVTGPISGIFIIDCDTQEGFDEIQKLIPDGLLFPLARTPRGGWHLWFKWLKEYAGKLTVAAGIMPGVDFRGAGGYIIAPPSKNSEGKAYKWEKGLSLDEVEIPSMPSALSSALNNNNINKYSSTRGSQNTSDPNRPQVTPSDFKTGSRDEALFSLAHHLLKGGMPEETVRNYLHFFSKHCDPPFPENETEAKIQSALNRSETLDRNISEEVRDFVLTSNGAFVTPEIYNRLQVTSRSEKKAVVKELLRLNEKGIIERHGDKNGCYRRIESQIDAEDWQNAKTETVKIWLPFEINEIAKIQPGNIITFMGDPNAGKTAALMNIAKEMMNSFQVHYFSSEMGPEEFKSRADLFPNIVTSQWKVRFYQRSNNFADIIKPGSQNVNIIDYLEMHDNFYMVAKHLSDIHAKLNGGIAIIGLQKTPGQDVGRGGSFALEKPRLSVALSSGEAKIVKCKAWQGSENPNGKIYNFKLIAGCQFRRVTGWHYPPK